MNLRKPLFALAGLAAIAACGTGNIADAAQQQRKVVLITGSTDGLGRELAFRIGASGAHVIVHGRNRERGMQVADSIQKLGKGATAQFLAADLASFAQVRALADTIMKEHGRLDLLINNAGIWLRNATSRELSADGNELSFQVNYLSGFLLTHRLKPLLVKSAPARVINVASRSQSPIDLDDVNQERSFSGQRGYTTSKLAQVMFTFDLARELEGTGVLVYAVHPASQMNTNMVRGVGAAPRSTVEEGADAVMNLVTSTGITTGSYYEGRAPGRANAQAYDEAARARLRSVSVRLTGLRP
jgi:NAD(P)-dependent dehydrogenase (short-subunit alcohol dehydrogenase family)